MIIPFFIPHSGCPHQCVFCNQKNITGQNEPEDLSFLPEKINQYLRKNASDRPVQVAFYGGSFTALSLDTQKAYLEAVRPFILSGKVKSIRLSTRPDSLTSEILHVLKENLVETVELGVQSLDEKVLKLSGRGHTASHTRNAVSLLREFSFTIGLQLMPGLPGDTDELFQVTVEQTIALEPDFVRIYPALVIKGTPLAELYERGDYRPLSIEKAVDLCRQALSRFEAAGIAVIRIGLQATEELEKTGTIIAGPYHPAFRQLVESSILLESMKSALSRTRSSDKSVRFLVHPADLSNAIGQKQSNMAFLKKEFGLNSIKIEPDRSIPSKTVKIVLSGAEGVEVVPPQT